VTQICTDLKHMLAFLNIQHSLASTIELYMKTARAIDGHCGEGKAQVCV
jgi:hypothetical protein